MGNYIPHKAILSIGKQEAIRHLIHAAIRMVAAQEDPFAIHLLVQSADKMLTDVADKTNKKLAFRFEDFIRPELKSQIFSIFRMTYNFFKHANSDHDARLVVGRIPEQNLVQLVVCSQNYKALYGEITDHMQLILAMSRLVFTDTLELGDAKQIFEIAFEKIKEKTLADFLGPEIMSAKIPGLPKLGTERAHDLQYNEDFYRATFGQLALRRSTSGAE